MPTYEIVAPDGKTYEVTGPNKEGAITALQQRLSGATGEASSSPGISAPPAPSRPSVPPSRPVAGMSIEDASRWARQQAPKEIGAFTQGVAQGLTLSTSDEIEAGIKTGAGLWGDYNEELNNVRQRMGENREASPTLDLAGEVTGGIVGVGGLAKNGLLMTPKVFSATPNKALRAASVMGEGALLSAADGFGKGTDMADRGRKAVTQGVIGGALSGVANSLLGPIIKRGAIKKGVTTSSQLESARRPFYETAKKMVIRPERMDSIIDDVVNKTSITLDDGTIKLTSSNLDPSAHVHSNIMRQRLSGNTSMIGPARGDDSLVRKMTLDDYDKLIQEFDEYIGKAEGMDRQMLIAMKDRLRSHMHKMDDSFFTSPGGAKAVAGIRRATDISQAKKKIEVFEKLLYDSDRIKGDHAHKIIQSLNDILASRTKSAGFSEAEMDVIRQAATMGNLRSILNKLAELSPDSLKGIAGMATASVFGSPILGASVGAAGGAAKIASQTAARRSVEDIMYALSKGHSVNQMNRTIKPSLTPTNIGVAGSKMIYKGNN